MGWSIWGVLQVSWEAVMNTSSALYKLDQLQALLES